MIDGEADAYDLPGRPLPSIAVRPRPPNNAARFSRAVVIPAPRRAFPIVVGRDFPEMVSATGKIELSRRRDNLTVGGGQQ